MSLNKTLGPDGWIVDGIVQPLVHWNAAGNALLDPQGNVFPLIKTEIASFSAAPFSVPTGLGTTTAINMSNTILDTDGTLVDLINDYVNVPTDATHCRAQMIGYFAANATGTRKVALEQHIGGFSWGTVAFEEKPSSGGAISTSFSFVYPLFYVSATSAPHLRLAVAQDSGVALNFTLSAAVFEFLKVV